MQRQPRHEVVFDPAWPDMNHPRSVNYKRARPKANLSAVLVNNEIAAFHNALGLRLDRMELSSGLCARLLPGVAESAVAVFNEDGLVRLRVARA